MLMPGYKRRNLQILQFDLQCLGILGKKKNNITKTLLVDVVSQWLLQWLYVMYRFSGYGRQTASCVTTQNDAGDRKSQTYLSGNDSNKRPLTGFVLYEFIAATANMKDVNLKCALNPKEWSKRTVGLSINACTRLNQTFFRAQNACTCK